MRRFSLLLVFAVLCVVAGPAFGSITHYITPDIQQHVSFVSSTLADQGALRDQGNGGPFVGQLYAADGITPVVGGRWTTFCVELSEFVTLSDWAKYDVVGTSTGYAGNPVTASGNIVSDETRWLYYESRHNPSLLAKAGGGNYVASNGTDNYDLQNAIWYGVDLGSTPAPDHLINWASMSANAQNWWTIASAAVLTPPTYPGAEWQSVAVLNPGHWHNDVVGGTIDHPQYQSMLYEAMYYAEAPEPMSLIVWTVLGAGAAGVALRRRRSRPRWSAENRQAIEGVIESKFHH